MTVEDLMELLKRMPPTAMVFVLAPLAINARPVFDRLVEDISYDTGKVVMVLGE